uniref:Uncharacterized protein n=1 Tax=Oryza punctata TaxID=4537 RepID=A0A0E0L5P8_ORYPU
MAKTKVSVLVAGVTLMCVILLVLSSAVMVEAGRQREGRERVVAARGRFRKVMREETTLDDGGAIGESKRRSPGEATSASRHLFTITVAAFPLDLAEGAEGEVAAASDPARATWAPPSGRGERKRSGTIEGNEPAGHVASVDRSKIKFKEM